MRVFGSERIKNMMGRFGMPEDQPIENRFISKTLEGAQAKIEGFHFDARKHTLEYDDVMNHQRKIIYERRQKMLRADKAEIEILLGDIAAEKENFNKVMEEKREKLGDETFFETVRRITLYTTDTLWMEHLEAMDYLRGSVNLRAYGQREPIVEYKKDGLRMFKEMEEVFKEQVASLIGTINTESAVSVRTEENAPKQTLVTSHTEPSELGGKKEKEVGLPRVGEVKAGRNDPCPCGSGKKYKKCHGK
ncbi:MAG: Protein translocase subunit SecA [Candidatus Nomurabacteria bacterium GW2011_GWF2_43_24]|nr:MAG: Protein translocase subunit SecA [Candidatus Nomurabacteria bacterium GW2011_GWF2_43_24]